jgi:hypothetical protein
MYLVADSGAFCLESSKKLVELLPKRCFSKIYEITYMYLPRKATPINFWSTWAEKCHVSSAEEWKGMPGIPGPVINRTRTQGTVALNF